MQDTTYMIRPGTGPRTDDIYTTPVLDVRYDWNTRVAERRASPIGTIQRLEHTTLNRKRFTVTVGWIDQDTPRAMWNERGQRGGPSWATRLIVKAGEQREHVRRMLPADAREMAGHDERISEAMAVVNDLRDKRKRFVRAAWKRALPVSVQELHDMVPADKRD